MSKKPRAGSVKPAKRDMRGKSVTLRDVAQDAGVSVMTVSNVINGKHALMSPQTRKTVEDAVLRLRYRPDSGARGLRLSQRLSVGILIIDPSPTFIADPFTTNLIAGLGNFLNDRGYALLVQGAHQETLHDSALLKNLRTDGLCIMPSGNGRQRLDIYRRCGELGQPVVIFQDRAPDFLADAASIRQDDFGGAAMLAERCLARGLKDLWFVTVVQSWPALEQREKGILDRLKRRGGKATLRKVACASDKFEDVQDAFGREVQASGLPEAVLCANDQVAIAVLKWLAENAVAVPERVAITGFNGFDFWRYSTPTVTTIQSPAYALGRSGGEAMLARLQNGRFPQRDLVHDLQLLVGESA
jgi:LacI family transcriptional regulator